MALFQKGHKLANGHGRPKGTGDSKRAVLTRMFLDRALEEWPQVCDTIFEQAHKGSVRMLELITSFAMAKPSHIVIEDAATRQLESTDHADELTTSELREIMTKYAQSKQIKGLPIDQDGKLIQ